MFNYNAMNHIGKSTKNNQFCQVFYPFRAQDRYANIGIEWVNYIMCDTFNAYNTYSEVMLIT